MFTKVDNPKLKEKSEVFSDITHASQRSYKFKSSTIVKVLIFLNLASKFGYFQVKSMQHHQIS
jgi:ADP-ribosylglycohydrolase